MNAITNQIQVVNTFTGEVLEFQYKNIQELKDAFVNLEAFKAAIERAHKKMKADLEFAMGDDEQVDFADGSRLKRFYRTSYTYNKEVVGKYLDADQLDLVTTVNGTALKSLIKELNANNSLPEGAWSDIELSAEQVTTEYVRLLKGGK
jgi:hypothetical protein